MAAVYTIEVRLDDKGVVTGVRSVNNELNKMGGGLRKAGQQGNLVMTELTKQQKNARDAAQLLSRSFGVEIPGALQKTLAKSQLLGGTLAAAFNVSVALAFAQAVATVVVDAIQKVIEHVNKFDDLVAEMETRRAIAGNKLILDAEERNRVLKLSIAKSTANDLKKIDLQTAFDKEKTQRLLREATENADIFAARQLEAQLLLIEKEGAVQKLAVRQALGEKAAAKARQEAESERGVLDQLRDMRNQAAAAGLPQEQALLTTWSRQVDKLIEIQKEYKKRPAVVQAVNETIKALDEAATREVGELRKKLKDQSKQELQEKNQKILDIERETAIARAEANGDMVEVMRLQEQFRVTDTIAKIQALVDAEKIGSKERADLEVKLAQLSQALHAQSNAKIALAEQDRNQQIIQENQRMVDQLAGSMESLWDDLWSGNIAQTALRMIKRFFFQILAQWLLTLGSMRSAGAGIGGGGGILGSLLGSLFGLGGGGGGGGLFGGLGGLGTVQGTPPFSPSGTQFSGGFTNFGGFIIPGGLTQQPLGLGLPSAGVSANQQQGQQGGGLLQLIFGAKGASILPQILGGIAGLAGGALMGLQSSSPILGGITGALGGGIGGSILGGLLFGAAGGPIGLVVGAIVGLVAGVLGGIFGRKKRSARAFRDAQKIWFEAKKQIEETVQAYKDHQLGFDDATSQLNDIRSQTADALIQATAQDRNSKWGKRYISQRLDPAVKEAKETIQKIENERQARGQTVFGPPQFHSGGFTGWGSGEFTAKLLPGEFVVNSQATAAYRSDLEKMNSSSRSAAASFLSSPPRFHSGGFADIGRGGGDIYFTGPVYAIDAVSFQEFLRNRGGLRALSKEQNRSVREYNPSA